MKHMTTTRNGHRLQGGESRQALAVRRLPGVLVPIIRFASLDQQNRSGDLAPAGQNLFDSVQHGVAAAVGGVTPKLPALPLRHLNGLGPVLCKPRRPIRSETRVVSTHS